MPLLELQFPVLGETMPIDHGHALYGAISRLVPAVHASGFTARIGPVAGVAGGPGVLRVDPGRSRLRIRVRPENLPALLPLAGQALDLAGHAVRLGVPNVAALTPAPSVVARLVTLKASSPRLAANDKESRDRAVTRRYLDPAEFLQAVQRDLKQRGIGGEATLPTHPAGPETNKYAGKPRRRVLRIHGKAIVGFTLLVQGLTAAESIQLQEEGLGGRPKLGCGFFLPIKGELR